MLRSRCDARAVWVLTRPVSDVYGMSRWESEFVRDGIMGKKKVSGSSRKGGAMMGMRTGLKNTVGQKKEASFLTVIGWVALVFLIGVVAWQMGGVGG